MIVGAHAIVYSTNPDADRAFLREVIGLPNVDVGGGWLIFGLPPSEVAVHPAEQNGGQELYLLVKDVKEFVNAMRRRKIACSPIHTERWGHVTNVTLPGGGALGVYQPLHARPPVARTAARRIAASRRTRKATKTQRRR